MKNRIQTALLALTVCACVARAEERQTIYTAAILPFQERGMGAKGYGEKVADLLFASLASDPHIWLVERAELDKALAEQEIGAAGMADAESAARIGKLTGAKLFITGSVIDAEPHLHIVAKVISTESGRVAGESVKGRFSDSIDSLAGGLAAAISRLVVERGSELVPKMAEGSDRLGAIRQALGDRPRPRLKIRIDEHHIGQGAPDPAAETEFAMLAREAGFPVVGPASAETADIVVQGEAFSELAMRRGNLVSVKARVEIKALDRAGGEVIAADRQTGVAVDLAEHIAGKAALQEAAAILAERLLPRLAADGP